MYSKLMLFDLQMNKLESKTWVMTESLSPDVLFDEIVLTAQKMMSGRGISSNKVLGMGVGAVGPVDRASGTILEPLYFPSEAGTRCT